MLVGHTIVTIVRHKMVSYITRKCLSIKKRAQSVGADIKLAGVVPFMHAHFVKRTTYGVGVVFSKFSHDECERLRCALA